MNKHVRNILIILGELFLLALLIWGPERLAQYRDKASLNQIIAEPVAESGTGFRYTLSSNEKLHILSQCLENQILPETEQSRKTRVESEEFGLKKLTGSYAFVVNYQEPREGEIKEKEIFDACNEELETLKKLEILPQEVREVTEDAYSATLYSAIDVLDPQSNMSVWKVSLSTSQQNADKSNRLLDVYVDAETGKIYEFYVRIEAVWEDLVPKEIVQKWSDYLGLQGMTAYETDNPLLETTPFFLKYRFPGMDENSTVVTIGFYEGIQELFLKIS